MTRRRVIVAAGVLAAMLVGGAGLGMWLLDRRGPALAEPVTIAIQEGERLPEVARQLARQGVLRWPSLFVAWARLSRQDRNVRWGEFRIAEPLSPRELLARILDGSRFHEFKPRYGATLVTGFSHAVSYTHLTLPTILLV